jgi:hypothetical protein
MPVDRRKKAEEYDGPEKRIDPWIPFDCETHCPQHGRNDQRLSAVEKEQESARKERCHMREKSEERHTRVWKELDHVKDLQDRDVRDVRQAISDERDLANRRIGEKVPIKHAIIAVSIVIGLFGWMMKINNDANERIALATAKTGEKIEARLEKLTSEVTTMKAIAEQKEKSSEGQMALLMEFRRISDSIITSMEKIAENGNGKASSGEK